jgi:hypothetical protein
MRNYGVLVLVLGLFAGGSAAAQVRIVKSVLGSGATSASDGSMVINATVGQPAIGFAASSTARGSFGFWSTSTIGLSVHAETGASAIEAMRILPNPATSNAEVRVVLTMPGRVEVRVYDPLGRDVLTLFAGEREAGDLVLPLDVSTLASGTYYVAVTAPGSVLQLPLTVVK